MAMVVAVVAVKMVMAEVMEVAAARAVAEVILVVIVAVMAVTAVMMPNRRLIVQQVSLQINPFQALKICSTCDHTIPYIKY